MQEMFHRCRTVDQAVVVSFLVFPTGWDCLAEDAPPSQDMSVDQAVVVSLVLFFLLDGTVLLKMLHRHRTCLWTRMFDSGPDESDTVAEHVPPL